MDEKETDYWFKLFLGSESLVANFGYYFLDKGMCLLICFSLFVLFDELANLQMGFLLFFGVNLSLNY